MAGGHATRVRFPAARLEQQNRLLGGFVLGLDAIGTNLDSLTVYLGPLEIRKLTLLAGRIVVTTQKDPVINHAGAFLALWALGSHKLI